MTTSAPTFVFPPELKPESTIGIISPGSWAQPEWINAAEDVLQELGYNVVVHSQNYMKQGRLAGSDAARAEAVNDMFADSTIDAIVCARGGAGSIRIIDKINYKLIKKHPKAFIGFSDATILLHAIGRRCGLVTYHGPMCKSFGQPYDKRTITDLVNVIGESEDKRVELHFPEVDVQCSGKVEGILTGGNISLLQSLMGSHYDWSAKDAILFIEDTNESLHKIDRMMRHMALAGRLKNVKAVLVGEMSNLSDGDPDSDKYEERPYGVDLKQILVDVLPPETPLCFNFPCGHGEYITTLPVGAYAHLTLDSCGAHLSFVVA